MSLTSMLSRFAFVSIVTVLGVMLLRALLEQVFGLSASGGLGIVTAMIPALDAGQTYARKTRQNPSSGFAWQVSGMFTLVHILLSGVLTFIIAIMTGHGQGILRLFMASGFLTGVFVLLGIMVVYGVVIRLFFGMGVKNTLKHQSAPRKTDET